MCGSRDVLVPQPEISRCQELSKVLTHLCRATVHVLPLLDMLIADVHNYPSALLQYSVESWPVDFLHPTLIAAP